MKYEFTDNIETELLQLVKLLPGSKEHKLQTYKKLREYTNFVVRSTTSSENELFCGVLSTLETSINNAGHEKRRSDDISYLWGQRKLCQEKIINKDNDY